MLDINLLRQDPERVKENIKKKFQEEKLVLVDEVVELDQEFREAKSRGDYCAASATPSASRSAP